MKTLKELQNRGTEYLRGYTDALVDIAKELMHPKVYDREHTGVLLNYLDCYINDLLKESKKNATK